jgi:hypothetical protein
MRRVRRLLAPVINPTRHAASRMKALRHKKPKGLLQNASICGLQQPLDRKVLARAPRDAVYTAGKPQNAGEAPFIRSAEADG